MALVVVVICVATLWAYRLSFVAPFRFDDLSSIVYDPSLRTFGLGALWATLVDAPPRFVGFLTFAFNYALGGLDPRGYHLFNFTVHLAAALVLFDALRRTLALPSIPAIFRNRSTELAGAAALLWALHPLQTQAVTYVVQRFESLMALFYLLTLYLVLRGARASRPWPWYLAAVLACWTGMGTKEVMATAPVVILLFDRIFLATSWRALVRARWGVYAGFFAALGWLLFGSKSLFDPSVESSAGLGVEGLSPWSYLASQPGVLLHYLRLAVWPDRLILDYGWPVASGGLEIFGKGAVILLLLGLTAWALWKRPKVGFLGAFFFLILAPTSSFMPIADLAFEHRMYLPLAALSVLLVLGLRAVTVRALPERLHSPVLISMIALLGFALMARTSLRNREYLDPAKLWTQAAENNPSWYRPWAALGLDHLYRASGTGREATVREAHLQAAEESFRRAMELKPNYFSLHFSLAETLQGLGKKAEAKELTASALRLAADNSRLTPNACFAKAVWCQQEGFSYDAMLNYRLAVHLDPDFKQARLNLAGMLAARGDVDEAIEHYQEALRVDPKYVAALRNLGNLKARQGEYRRAIELFSRAVQEEPTDGLLLQAIGVSYLELGDPESAVAPLREALVHRPDLHLPKINLAWILATNSDPELRDGSEALRLALEARQALGQDDARTLDVLGAAYASVESFETAAELAAQAHELALASGEQILASEIGERVALYQAARPFLSDAQRADQTPP